MKKSIMALIIIIIELVSIIAYSFINSGFQIPKNQTNIFERELSIEEEIEFLRKGKTIAKVFYKNEKPKYIFKLSQIFEDQVIFELINSSFEKFYVFSPYYGEQQFNHYNYSFIKKVLCKLVIERPPACIQEII